jgi:hypothetical protein
MTIQFHCEHCGNLVQAPDDAGGKRGKCPHCQGSNFIPAPQTNEIDLTPMDEEEERRRQREVEKLLQAERDILAETSHEEKTPRVSQMDTRDVSPADLHHLVVNYCLAISRGNLQDADVQVMKLNQHSGPNRQAVSDFIDGKVLEPALDAIPVKVLQGFLKTLARAME